MSAIFSVTLDPKRPIRLVNVRTLGAMCGCFATYAEAEDHLRDRGYEEWEFWREAGTVCFEGGINC